MKILKIDEAKVIIKKMEKKNFTWFPLGGKTNNAGIIEMISDPNSALTERLTNAIDAVLEREVESFDQVFNNPYELSNQITKTHGKKYLENRVSIILHKSGDENKMTIEILDSGIGIQQDEFTKTILELNGSNKLNKKYLMGAFGQGGSTSVKFNKYTIIYSRKNGKEYFTIIRYNEGDENTKNGVYEFLAIQKRKNIAFAPSNELTDDGTSIINIAMDYVRTGSINGSSNSVFSALTNKLFNPCFPITFRDERTPNQLISEQKKLKGVPYNLSKIKDPYSGNHVIKTKTGNDILLSWWLIMPDLKNIGIDVTNEYYKKYLKNARVPFNLTINGQTQGYISNKLLTDAGLSFLDRRFVCQVNLNNLNKQERRELFTSTRETINEKSIIKKNLEIGINKFLKNSPELKKANKLIKNSYTNTNSNNEFFRAQLNKELKKIMAGFTRGDITEKNELKVIERYFEEKENSQNKIEDSLYEKPTFFKIVNTNPFYFDSYEFKIKYKTDGEKIAIMNNLDIKFSNNNLFIESVSQNKGNGIIIVKAENILVGTSLQIIFTYPPLDFKHTINVVKTEPNAPKKSGFPTIKINWISEEDNLYREKRMNKDTPIVVEYSINDNSAVIYFNIATFPIDSKLIKTKKSLMEFKDSYAMSISIYLVTLINKGLDLQEYDYRAIATNAIWNFDVNSRK